MLHPRNSGIRVDELYGRMSPLHSIACYAASADEELVWTLLDLGLSPFRVDFEGHDSYMRAWMFGNTAYQNSIVKYMETHDLPRDVPNKIKQDNLQWLAEEVAKGCCHTENLTRIETMLATVYQLEKGIFTESGECCDTCGRFL